MSKTIEFFKEIANIPRESGNEKEISDYICKFAEDRGLEYIQDKYNNVIIKSYKGENEPIILQAHMDMVCEKEVGLEFDFKKDKIQVVEQNGFLKAKGTTLGADNGIGVAQILNILDYNLPINIEAVFTTEEETTMMGAESINLSMLKGKQMINLDGFEKDVIINESAGFVDIIIKTDYKYIDNVNNNIYKITLEGMEGGHSGFEIDKGKGNSIIELANLLRIINSLNLISFDGGTKFNVIPSQAECYFKSDIEFNELIEIVEEYEKNKRKYNNIKIVLEKKNGNYEVISQNDSCSFINAIINLKNGVFYKNENGSPSTSSNLGIVSLKDNVMKIGFRSSKIQEQKKGLEILKNYCIENNFEFKILDSQPGFETNPKSGIVKKLIDSYKNTVNKNGPIIKSVHITVEAGILKNKIPGLEVVIISPNILGAHSVNECVEIKSINECDIWLENFLKSNV